MYPPEETPYASVAIVFGAGLLQDGSPTAVLKDRVATAVELYQGGKVKKILMSGDNRLPNYNEPGAMLSYALKLGVSSEDVVLDYAGRRTYDSCYRAQHIFGIHDALLISQRFHLPRAIYTCNTLGLNANGVIANRRSYVPWAHFYWQLREFPASFVALWDLWVSKPTPVLGDPEPIFSVDENIQ